MPDIKLHQDVFGGKAGTTVTVTDDEATWALAEGYASAAGHSGEDVAGEPAVEYDATGDPTLAENSPHPGHEPQGLTDAGRPAATAPLQTPEAFNPDDHTVDQVTEYFESLDEGSNGDSEKRRVKAVEAAGQNRAGIASL